MKPDDPDMLAEQEMHEARHPKRKRLRSGPWSTLRPEDYLQVQIVTMLRKYQRLGVLKFIVCQPERLINKYTTEYARSLFLALGIFGNAGHVEILVLFRDKSKTMLWELKRPRGRMTDEQANWRDWSLANGYAWHKPETVEEARSLIVGALVT